MYNADQVLNGLISYADSEIMGKLPTSGKWIMGTAIGLASNKAQTVINALINIEHANAVKMYQSQYRE